MSLTYTFEYVSEFSPEFEIAPMVYSGARRKLILVLEKGVRFYCTVLYAKDLIFMINNKKTKPL